MQLGAIHPAAGSTRPSKRRGKGAGTGLGGTAGKGHKGHKARAGGKIPVWFEGGQMPIQRRLPKRGFVNPNRIEYQPIAVARLASAAAGTVIDRDWLRKAGLVRGKKLVKLLGGGAGAGAAHGAAWTRPASRHARPSNQRAARSRRRCRPRGDMLEKLRNIFAVPELKRRILFTLVMFAVYRLGEHTPSPGVNTRPWQAPSRASVAPCSVSTTSSWVGHSRGPRCSRSGSCPTSRPRSSCSSSARWSRISRSCARRAKRAEEDHAADPLRHGGDLDHPVVRLQRVPDQHGRVAGRDRGAASGIHVHAVDHHHPDHGHHPGHVARGEDHRSTASATASR